MKILDIPQGSDQWHMERFRSVTGTKIQSAIGAKYSAAKGWTLGNEAIQNTLLMELVSEYQSELEIDDYCSADMERGNDLEPLSVAAASERLSVDFVPCGMLQSDTLPSFKFSPDAVCFGKNGLVVGGYETKSKSGKKHIEYMMKDEVPHEHLWQCLCPMIMDDSVKWWAFGHFDDRNHVNNLFIKGLKREDYEDLIQEARVILAKFLIQVELTVKELGGVYHG